MMSRKTKLVLIVAALFAAIWLLQYSAEVAWIVVVKGRAGSLVEDIIAPENSKKIESRDDEFIDGVTELAPEVPEVPEVPIPPQKDVVGVPSQICDTWVANATAARDCFLGEMTKQPDGNTYWKSIAEVVTACAAKLRDVVQLMLITNADDTKGFIDFVDAGKLTEADSCVSLTLGIGNDIMAETQLKHVLPPHCHFIGADPMPNAGNVFQSLGTYFQVGVSNETGNQKASVMEDIKTHKYGFQDIRTVEFVEFLTTMANVSVVDFLLFDAEGAEYKLMKHFHRDGPLEKAGIAICQLSLEMHGPATSHGFTDVGQLKDHIHEFFVKSDFVPIWASPAGWHYRTFLINWKNPVCFKRFFRNKC